VLLLVFGAWKIALVFSFLNVTMLWWRIRIKNAALGRGIMKQRDERLF